MKPQANFKPLLWVIIIVAYSLCGCEDIFETDLEKQALVLMAPANNTSTNSLNQNFWWEEVEGKLKYNLQIVTHSFANPGQLVMDTNLTEETFTYSLFPDTFQWRVRAFNGSSSTPYSVYTLVVDSAVDLSGQQVVLISPANNYVTKATTVLFKWYELANANDYRFEIKSPDASGQLVFNPVITEYDSITLSLDEGFYAWGVQAQNNTSGSLYTWRAFTVDRTAPATPVLTSPANNATITDSTVTLSWTRGANAGSAIHDSLYVFRDSLLNNLKIAVYLTDSSYSLTLDVTGYYFWLVRSIDAAGNYSNYSATRKLRHQ